MLFPWQPGKGFTDRAPTRQEKGRGQMTDGAGGGTEERQCQKERAQTPSLTRNHAFWLSTVGASVLEKLPPPPPPLPGWEGEISSAAFRVSIHPSTKFKWGHFSGNPCLKITSFRRDQAQTATKGNVSHIQGTLKLHFLYLMQLTPKMPAHPRALCPSGAAVAPGEG